MSVLLEANEKEEWLDAFSVTAVRIPVTDDHCRHVCRLGMAGAPAFAQGGGGLFGGLFRGRTSAAGSANLGYYPYYGNGGSYSTNPGYNIYGNYGVYGYPGSQIEGGAGNAGYDPGYGGYPSYDGYGITNRNQPAAPAVGPLPTQRRLLGIDEEPVVLGGGVKAMKIGKVYPGTAAERAGLRAGDVIRSVNGYLTEQRGNLAWVIANADARQSAQAQRANRYGRPNAPDFGHYSLIVAGKRKYRQT